MLDLRKVPNFFLVCHQLARWFKTYPWCFKSLQSLTLSRFKATMASWEKEFSLGRASLLKNMTYDKNQFANLKLNNGIKSIELR